MALEMKLRYVHEDVDRYGNVRIYFYKRGGRKVRLTAKPNTDDFLAQYRDALRTAFEPQPARVAGRLDKPTPGTWRAVAVAYFASAAFADLDPRTQRVRRQIIEHTFAEPIAPGADRLFADMPLVHFGTKAVKVLRDRKAATKEAANARVKAVRQVFAWALEAEYPGIRINPARDVAYLKSSGDGFHSWTFEEVEQYQAHHAVGTSARLALELLLLTGVRRSDVVVLGRQHMRDGWFKFTPVKGRKRGKPLEIPVLPELAAVIEQSPCGDLAFLQTAFRRPFTANGFGNRFRKWCDEAGLPAHCAAHGLRKAGAAIAAENGATDFQLMSIFGWATIKEAQRYTKAARRKSMAESGMPLLVQASKSGTNVSHPKTASLRSGDK